MKGIRDAGANDAASAQGSGVGDLPVSSRRDALEMLRREVTLHGSGPVLLTGEPGAGKTWLWCQFVRGLPARWHWLSVDMSGALDAREFLELIGHGLGISVGDRLGSARLALARALEEEATEGRSWILVIENAQNTPEPVWSELQALAHGMEASFGFSSMILVGTTELTRLLAARARRAMASRLAAHVHLLPLDLEECRELAELEQGIGFQDRAALEELHRDAAGNPRRVRQLLRKRTRSIAAPPPRSAFSAPRKMPELMPEKSVAPASPAPADGAAAASASPVAGATGDPPRDLSEPTLAAPLVPSRPPLRVEEGLIEVGWEGSLEAEPAAAADDEAIGGVEAAERDDNERPPSEETIDDHYAALQAWSEWARNRGRSSSVDDPAIATQAARGSSDATIEEDAEQGQSRLAPLIRVESQHEHAPYSQLFSQLRQAK